MCIDRVVWETQTTGAHPGVLQVLAEHADLLLQKLPRGPDLVERTRQAIGERLRGGDSSLESVARGLGTSARSLQRHLRELGYSYNELADASALPAPACISNSPTSRSPKSHLLGFSDQSTFNRAFKRWTGQTPARSRALLSGRERQHS